MTNTSTTNSATIERFHVTDDLAEALAALERDGPLIVEGLLSAEVVTRVNEEVESAVASADPDGPMFIATDGPIVICRWMSWWHQTAEQIAVAEMPAGSTPSTSGPVIKKRVANSIA
jgi:hypothetical protein